MYRQTDTRSYQYSAVLGRVGTSNVRNICQRRNGLLSLFPINQYTYEIDWFAGEYWISSDIPSRESVVIAPWDELRAMHKMRAEEISLKEGLSHLLIEVFN
jgi:hypothetical protein